MEFASISWVLWRTTFTKAMRVATLEDNKREIILNDIAPALRVAEPGKVPNCEEIQQKYEVKRRKHTDPTEERIVIQTTNYQPEPSAPILTPTSLCHMERNTESFQSLYPNVPLSVTGGTETSQVTTPVPPNQSTTVAGAGLQQNEIKEFVNHILEDRYAEARNDFILQLRAEANRAEGKWNERILTLFQEAVTTNDRKNAALAVQLREEMAYTIEKKMINLVANKDMDLSKLQSPVGERNVGPFDETGPARESTNIGILIPEINDETITINFPLFYFGNGLSLPTSVNVLQNETIENLLPDNFTKILKSYFDDALEHGVRMDGEHRKFYYLCQVIVALIIFALYVACFSILIIVTRSQLVVILGTVLIVLLCLSWLCFHLTVRSKKKRSRERALFDRLDGYCKQLTEASPRLFQRDIKIQMLKTFDHKTSRLKSARLYKISDQNGNDIYTPVYFRVSFEVKPGTYTTIDLKEAISVRLYNLEVITDDCSPPY